VTVSFFELVGAILWANMLTVGFIYCARKLDIADREGKPLEWLHIVPFVIVMGVLSYSAYLAKDWFM